ncbi:MAG: hypothetical protein FIB04_06010 [Gammaproteobacteria bacterium]|nr:hypothetical protein [Gammaproteobacteria bacterium]
MTDQKNVAGRLADGGPDGPTPAGRRSKFGAAAEGWDAYNTWLDRVRAQQGPTSRQAVIAKALYSVSSYKNWADKARDAFDKGK